MNKNLGVEPSSWKFQNQSFEFTVHERLTCKNAGSYMHSVFCMLSILTYRSLPVFKECKPIFNTPLLCFSVKGNVSMQAQELCCSMPISHECSCDLSSKYNFVIARFNVSRLNDLLAVSLLKLNHSKQPHYEVQPLFCMWSVKFYQPQCAVWGSSSASCQHILTECIHKDTLPLSVLFVQ